MDNRDSPAAAGDFETLSQRVARRLRGRMAELQLRGTDVAAAIGMTQGSFSRRNTGAAAWELDELEQLEAKVGISVAYLLGWAPAPEQTTTGAIVIQQASSTPGPQFRPASARQVRPPAEPEAVEPAPVKRELPPAPEDPPVQPTLQYPDHSPIRFDAGAWPGVPSRHATPYATSA